MFFNCQTALLCFLVLSPVACATHDDDEDGAVPATPAFFVDDAGAEPGFTPRYYAGGFPAYRLGGRQAAGLDCGDPTKSHSCGELGAQWESVCCSNDRYCFFGANWTAQCCSIGNKCGQCSPDQIQGNLTKTSTFDSTKALISGATNTEPVVVQTWSEQIFESRACTPRKCAASEFQCPKSLGGRLLCCLSGGLCAVGVTPPPTGPVPTANGCPSKNMFACAASLGGACCTNGQTCVVTNGVQGCEGQPTSPPGTEITYNGGGLSQGAKAGIGVGVAVVAAVIIGFVTWFCLRQRRRARSSAYRSQQHRNHQYQSVGQAGGGAAGLGIGGTTEVMSEVSAPSRTGPHRTGLVYEYFGPDAVAGPYTQQEDEFSPTTRETHGGMWDWFARRAAAPAPPSAPRAVPVQPQNPGDIAAPVELGSTDPDPHLKAMHKVQAAKTTPTPSVAPAPASTEQQAVFELWGSPGETLERSPLDEAGDQQQQQQQQLGEQGRPHSHISSNTEYRNSQENPNPHSTESGSTAAESAQNGGDGYGREDSTTAAAATENAHDGQGRKTGSGGNNHTTQV
ncbi:hypothetical protein PG989_009684 [Apiospora arundinis]